MDLKIIHTNNAPAAVGPYSQAVKAGNLLFVSGQIPINPENGELVKGSIEDETRQCLENAIAILKEANTDINKVVKCTVFIKNMDQFGQINEIYGQYFLDHKPARACVEVARLPKDVNVEIEMIALV